MSQNIPLHKDTEHFTNALWWMPFFSLQRQAHNTLRDVWDNSLVSSLPLSGFYQAEQSMFLTVQRKMHRLLSEIFNTRQMLESWWGQGSAPRVDIAESEARFRVQVELPGVNAADVNISIAEDVLLVEGKKHGDGVEAGEHYIRQECCTGSFCRTVALPDEVDIQHATAVFDANVLTVDIPKRGIAVSRKVQIRNVVGSPEEVQAPRQRKQRMQQRDERERGFENAAGNTGVELRRAKRQRERERGERERADQSEELKRKDRSSPIPASSFQSLKGNRNGLDQVA